MKIRIAIVDDELTSRNTIKKMLADSDRYEVMGVFSDAKTALEWIRNNEIDILLCDIQMPDMSGLELMRMVRLIWNFLPVVAISGFADFDYVRGSLVNGAADYLLKHELTKEKLLKVLDGVCVKYRIEPTEKAVISKTGWCIREAEQFTAETIRKMTDSEQIDFCCRNTLAIAISPDYQIPEKAVAAEYKKDICQALIDIIGQSLGQEYKYIIYHTRNEQIILIISFGNTISTFYALNVMQNLTNRISRQSIRMLDTTLTIVTGDLHLEVEESVKEGQMMEKILEDKLYLGGNRITAMAVTKKMELHRRKIQEASIKKVQFELENNLDSTVETINQIFADMENGHYDRKSVCEGSQLLLSFLPENMEGREEAMNRIADMEFLEQFKGIVLDQVWKSIALRRKHKETFSPMIKQIVDYMRKNYNSDISLEKCVELVGSSYSYLSREFKKETGMRFVEYLNQLRIAKAKSLLLSGDISMKEVVEQTGFRNYNYFFKVFKEAEGMTPGEFAAKN